MAGKVQDLKLGVLALQGDFDAHRKRLEELNTQAFEVRKPEQLEGLAGLIIPGGESTTLLKHMEFEPRWWTAFPAFHERGGIIFGTCAGMILLAREVRSPAQRSLALLDAVVERNAYGRQKESFVTTGEWQRGGALEMVFIRAPMLVDLGSKVKVLARHGDQPVFVEQGRVLAASFHPELTKDRAVHEYFVERCRGAS